MPAVLHLTSADESDELPMSSLILCIRGLSGEARWPTRRALAALRHFHGLATPSHPPIRDIVWLRYHSFDQRPSILITARLWRGPFQLRPGGRLVTASSVLLAWQGKLS